MKQRLKRLLVRLMNLLPGKPVILLESAPPLGDNTGALYRTLLAQGWNDHNRSGRYTALESAKNYLNSCAPNAILFTNGDNDTFPLW